MIIVVAMTLAAALLGAALGYNAAGIGGALLFAACIGVGGWLLGTLLVRTTRVLGLHWKISVAAAALIVVARVTWGVYF